MFKDQKTKNLTSAGKNLALRVSFDRNSKLEFHGTKVTSDAGLLAYRELHEALGLTAPAEDLLNDPCTGQNTQHSMTAMRQVVGGRAIEHTVASTTQMRRFETEVLIQPNKWLSLGLAVLAALLPLAVSAGESRLEILRFDSQLLKANPLHDPSLRSVAIFLPPQATNGARLPIVYYLPGYGGSADDYINDSKGWLEYTRKVADEIAPVIFVIVDGRTRWGGSQYLNSPAQGDYENYVCDEIRNLVEASHPVPAEGVRRIIAGHSSGGFGALRLGMSRPELFDGVIALSPDADFPVTQMPLVAVAGVTNIPFAEITRIAHGVSPMPNGDLNYAFGLSAAYAPRGPAHPGEFDWIYDIDGHERKDVLQRWLDNDPMVIAQKNPRMLTGNQSVYLDGAAQDEFKANVGARAVFDVLQARNSHCTFDEPPGHHADHVRERLRRGVAWIFGQPLTDVRSGVGIQTPLVLAPPQPPTH